MEDALKNRVVIILGVFTLIFFISSVSSCSSASRFKKGFDKEMLSRLDLEERMSKFNQEKGVLEEKLKAANKELAEQSALLDATKKALAQEQLINQSLKDELLKVSKFKETLEAELTTGKKSKSMK
jgi:biopolymer transport protein ExbB/TolQ